MTFSSVTGQTKQKGPVKDTKDLLWLPSARLLLFHPDQQSAEVFAVTLESRSMFYGVPCVSKSRSDFY